MTHVTVDTNALTAAVKAAAAIISGAGDHLPALHSLRLTASEGALEVAATDLDITLTQTLTAAVGDEVGNYDPRGAKATLVNARDASRLLAAIRDETVTLVLSDDPPATTVVTSAGAYRMPSLPVVDYPALPEMDSEGHIVDALSLHEGLAHAGVCASTDDARPNLNGVYFCALDDGMARMVTTDGHRLALCERKVGLPAGDPLIIPQKALKPLRGVLGSTANADACVAFMESNFVVKVGASTMFIRLIDLKFPAYEAVIPKPVDSPVVVERSALLDLLKRAELFSNDRTRAVHLKVSATEMTVESQDADRGKSIERIAVSYGGDDVDVFLRGSYLRDVITTLGTKKVALHIQSPTSPVMVRPVAGGDDTYVIMPIRV